MRAGKAEKGWALGHDRMPTVLWHRFYCKAARRFVCGQSDDPEDQDDYMQGVRWHRTTDGWFSEVSAAERLPWTRDEGAKDRADEIERSTRPRPTSPETDGCENGMHCGNYWHCYYGTAKEES